jgi:hypothetical protein
MSILSPVRLKGESVRLADLSALPRPGPGWLMSVLRSHFDDRGEASNPDHKAAMLCGVLGTVEDWDRFDREWQTHVLGTFDLDYVHMKELKGYDGKFAKFKDNPSLTKCFFRAMATVVNDCCLHAYSSTVWANDLVRFNSEHGQSVNDYALNLYSCMRFLKVEFGDAEVEVLVDRSNDVHHKMALAEGYAESDGGVTGITDTIGVMPINKARTAKTLLPLQAADFLAWELRRDAQEMEPWVSTLTGDESYQEYLRGRAIFLRSNKRNVPFHRRSLTALVQATRLRHTDWGYRELVANHQERGGVWQVVAEGE